MNIQNADEEHPVSENLKTESQDHNLSKQEILMKHGHKFKYLFLYILVLVILIGGIYSWQNKKIASLSSTQVQKQVQITKTENKLADITNENNGVIINSGSSLPADQVGLVNNKIILTLPSGYIKATATDYSRECSGYTIDAKVICLDAATLIPKSINSNPSSSNSQIIGDPTNQYNFGSAITVQVFEYNNNASSILDWFNDNLQQSASPGDTTSSSSINGYQAYYLLNNQPLDLQNESYENSVYYAITNGTYVVVVSALVNEIYSNVNYPQQTFDYSQYLPQVKSVAYSIKIES